MKSYSDNMLSTEDITALRKQQKVMRICLRSFMIISTLNLIATSFLFFKLFY
jgi:hypothetical protein